MTADVINFAFYVRLIVLHRDTRQLCIISCKDFFTYYIINVANKYYNSFKVPYEFKCLPSSSRRVHFEGEKKSLCVCVNTKSAQELVLDPAGGVMSDLITQEPLWLPIMSYL